MTQPRLVALAGRREAPHRRAARRAIDGLELELLDLVQDAVIVRDLRDATIRYWNHGAEVLYGWTKDEAIGRVAHELLHTVSPQPLDEIQAELLRTGLWEGELVHRRRDGTRVAVASRWVRHAGGRGQPTLHLEVNSDLTARKQAETEVAARVAVESAMRARNDAISTIAHDLKNPLTAIRGQVQLLRRRATGSGSAASGDVLGRGLNHIEASAQRAVEQLDEVLETSRLQIGERIELECAPTDLVALVRDAVGVHQETTDRHNLLIECSEDEVLGLWDMRRLRRVVDNLLSNAIKYSPYGGTILVTLGTRSVGGREWGLLTVRDEGIGIPQEDLPYVFDPYRRGGNVRGVMGSGIGLAGSRRIVEQHGGSVDIESAEGEGTSVVVRLPVDGPATT